MLKECKHHGLTEFRNESKLKVHWRCKRCASQSVINRRRKVKQMAVEYKGGQCETCGYKKYIGALDFHHMGNKSFGISQYGYSHSWTKVKKEIDKCILLCANCHRELYDKEYSSVLK